MSRLADAARRLAESGIDNPRLEARLLLAHVLGVDPNDLTALTSADLQRAGEFEALLQRRLAREPIAYILGEKEFWSLRFAVGPGVLIPPTGQRDPGGAGSGAFSRSRRAATYPRPRNRFGCLLFAVLSEFQGASGIGIDSSVEALAWAERNRAALRLTQTAKLVLGTWAADGAANCDVILSNPPYIRSADIPMLEPDVRLHEPMAALDGGVDGLDAYRALGPEIRRLLAPNGFAFVEIGSDQGDEVPRLLSEAA